MSFSDFQGAVERELDSDLSLIRAVEWHPEMINSTPHNNTVVAVFLKRIFMGIEYLLERFLPHVASSVPIYQMSMAHFHRIPIYNQVFAF